MSIKSTTESIKYSDAVSSKPVTQNVYEELPPPTEYYKPQPKPKPLPVPARINKSHKPSEPDSTYNVGIVDLKDGVYNEAESHNQFLDALNAWRNSGKPEKKKWQEIEKE